MNRRNILLLLTSACIVTVIWVGFNTYHAAISSTINSSLTGEITPIPPSFNTNVINNLQSREQVTPAYDLGGANASSTSGITQATPTAIPSPTPSIPIASPSAQIIP